MDKADFKSILFVSKIEYLCYTDTYTSKSAVSGSSIGHRSNSKHLKPKKSYLTKALCETIYPKNSLSFK